MVAGDQQQGVSIRVGRPRSHRGSVGSPSAMPSCLGFCGHFPVYLPALTIAPWSASVRVLMVRSTAGPAIVTQKGRHLSDQPVLIGQREVRPQQSAFGSLPAWCDRSPGGAGGRGSGEKATPSWPRFPKCAAASPWGAPAGAFSSSASDRMPWCVGQIGSRTAPNPVEQGQAFDRSPLLFCRAGRHARSGFRHGDPILLACSSCPRQMPLRSAPSTSSAGSYRPRSNCAGASRTSRTTPRRGSVRGSSRVGSRCRCAHCGGRKQMRAPDVLRWITVFPGSAWRGWIAL